MSPISPSTSPSSPVSRGTLADQATAPHGGRKPSWLKVSLPGGKGYARLKGMTQDLGLHTVCEEARCPNIGECWRGDHATMTLMVLGDECTRRCRFCAVKTVEHAAPPDPEEPDHVGRAVGALEASYIVLTSVDRDDLADGGARHFADCIRSLREHAPHVVVEALIPDYTGARLETLMAARPDVLAHNVEVVAALQRKIRDPRCSFEASLAALREAKSCDPEVFTKSSLMLGLGESQDEVLDSLEQLREAQVDFVTLGQYLRPGASYAPVKEYVTPERFAELKSVADEMGFLYAASGPLVRSSYRAGEYFAGRLVRDRRAQDQSNSGASAPQSR